MDVVAGESMRLLLAAMLVAINIWLYWPLFIAEEHIYRGSIMAGYAGMARFFASHPDPWGWNPFSYAGLPAQFTYLPLLPYTAAVLARIASIEPDVALRLVTATLSALTPLSMAACFYYFTRRMWWAWLVGLAVTFYSPAYGLMPGVEDDAGLFYIPWRVQIMVKYGELPHCSALALMPLALAALHAAAAKQSARRVVLAAMLLAAVSLSNWLASFALALAALTLLVHAIMRRETLQAMSIIKAGLLGYGFAAFWLTPSFVQTTLFNWPRDAFDFKPLRYSWALQLGLLGVVVFCSWLGRRLRLPEYLSLFTAQLLLFLSITAGYFSWNVDIIPESRRYAPEFELFLIMFAAGWMSWGLSSSRGLHRFCTLLPLAMMLLNGAGQLRAGLTQNVQSWKILKKNDCVELWTAKWLADHHVEGRAVVSGGTKFRLHAWYLMPQTGGTFESGLTNRMPVDMLWQARTGTDLPAGKEVEATRHLLAALGAEYVAVHRATSSEYYRDWKNLAPLEAIGTEVFRPSPADTVYKVPFHGLARLLRAEELPAGPQAALLERYGAALLDTVRPQTPLHWQGTSAFRVDVPAHDFDVMEVRVSYHPQWKAEQGGRELELSASPLGYLQVKMAKGLQGPMQFRFTASAQQRTGAAISGLATLLAGAALWRSRR
jgi:hypothetical protein